MKKQVSRAKGQVSTWLGLFLMVVFLLSGVALASESEEPRIYYKLDPRLTKGLHMGERWVSPPTYSVVQNGKTFSVEAKSGGGGADGAHATWTPSDSRMLSVKKSKGNAVLITVKKAGQCKLNVVTDSFSKVISVHAGYLKEKKGPKSRSRRTRNRTKVKGIKVELVQP